MCNWWRRSISLCILILWHFNKVFSFFCSHLHNWVRIWYGLIMMNRENKTFFDNTKEGIAQEISFWWLTFYFIESLLFHEKSTIWSRFAYSLFIIPFLIHKTSILLWLLCTHSVLRNLEEKKLKNNWMKKFSWNFWLFWVSNI